MATGLQAFVHYLYGWPWTVNAPLLRASFVWITRTGRPTSTRTGVTYIGRITSITCRKHRTSQHQTCCWLATTVAAHHTVLWYSHYTSCWRTLQRNNRSGMLFHNYGASALKCSGKKYGRRSAALRTRNNKFGIFFIVCDITIRPSITLIEHHVAIQSLLLACLRNK